MALGFAASALAAGFPEKTISIVVPFTAGGPTDRVARDLAEAMRGPLGGATIVVENISGAGGAIGTARVAKAAPDGYVLLLNHIGMATMPTLLRKPGFDVESDFEFLGLVNDVPMTLISRPGMPADSYADLVKWIRANRGKVSIGNAGIGSASQLCGMLFQAALGINMNAIPYKGTGPAISDLMGGQIDLMCDQTTNTAAQIEARKVKAFAVTSPRRLSLGPLKELPTLQELGVKDFAVSVFHGLYGPRGMPADVAKKLNAAVKAALKDPDFIRKQEGLGAVVVADARAEPAGHRASVGAEIAKWRPLIKAAGIYAD
jgi:tripartite-type tricarboxylate transporter receptor subunit TctC